MNARERLDEYLTGLRQRLQWAIVTRASAALLLSALALLCAAILWLAPLGFPRPGVAASRAVFIVALLAAAVLLLWLPLRRLRSDITVLERQLPEQRGRIQTFVELRAREAKGDGAPLIDLLAEDALTLAKRSPLESVVTPRRLWIGGAMAAVAFVVLAFLLGFGPAHWGYGSRHLLLGADLPATAVPVRQVFLQPGNKTLRRNSDLQVQAKVRGFKPEAVQLFVQFEGEPEWERAPMQAVAGEEDGNYQLTLYALRAPVTYYAQADGVKSEQYRIAVVDAPRIDSMRLDFDYPEWTGLQSATETEVRDVRAVADTGVRVTIQADQPLDSPVLVFDASRSAMGLAAKPNVATGDFVVEQPGRYHIAARVAGELVALTDDYEITLVEDQPPTVEVVKPGRDWRATSVEEVPVAIRAQDDFRVQQLELRYAVNGGEWRAIKLPAGVKQVDARSLLQMETLGGDAPLIPGDLVTYYAMAKDRKHSVQTDLFMVQVQPFERRFSEGQGGGGGGDGGGSEQEQIAQRQRDILVATWNLQRAKDQNRRTPQQIRESADMLSGLQNKLAEQTNTLIERTRARTLGNTDARVKQFLESLTLAAKAMEPAAAHLGAIELEKAVPNEQQALQMLLRAESSFRDIQVSRQQDNQGGGGGGAGRDISELYELEMDLNRNKYETERQLSQAQESNPEVDEAIAKLKELAERQEKLAEQQRQQPQPTNADRWRQEQLRREAEELRRQLQELARQQSGQQQSGQQSSQQSGQQSNQQSAQQSGGQNQSEAQLRAALNAVENALQAMRNAEKANDSGQQGANAAEQASRNLRQAARNMEQSESARSPAGDIERLADQAKRAADAQRDIEMDMYRAVSGSREGDNAWRPRRDGLTPQQAQQLADAKRNVLEQVKQLEDAMRQTTQRQRGSAPKTAERLGEIVDELSSVNPQSRLQRGIVDLERGRADQALMGEGLITEALQNAASDLRDTARMATREAQQRADSAEPEALLAELAQLRRALEAARNSAAGEQDRQTAQSSGQQEGQQQAQQSGQQSGQQPGQQANQQSAQGRQGGAQPGQQAGAERGSPNAQFGGGALTGGLDRHRIGDGELPRLNAAIRQQLNAIQNRIAGGTITRRDLEALRALLPQINRLAGNPVADRAQALESLQSLELAALAAAEKARKQAATRAGAPSTSAVADGETVAEYYRRLAQ